MIKVKAHERLYRWDVDCDGADITEYVRSFVHSLLEQETNKFYGQVASYTTSLAIENNVNQKINQAYREGRLVIINNIWTEAGLLWVE